MKLVSPKSISISLTAVAVSFVAGMALMSHPVSQPVHLFKATADTSTAQITTDPASTTTTQTAPATTTTDPSASSSPASTSTPADTTTSTSSTTTTSQSAPAAPAVTATDAQLTDWSAAAPSTDPNQLPGTTFQTRYCVYTYSDGSTQQRLYQTIYIHDTIVSYNDATFVCSVATAPAVN